MDAVELAIPAAAAVAVPKLMESEGFGGDRVTVSDAKTCESDGVSVSVSDKMEKWSSLFAHRGFSSLILFSKWKSSLNGIKFFPVEDKCSHGKNSFDDLDHAW